MEMCEHRRLEWVSDKELLDEKLMVNSGLELARRSLGVGIITVGMGVLGWRLRERGGCVTRAVSLLLTAGGVGVTLYGGFVEWVGRGELTAINRQMYKRARRQLSLKGNEELKYGVHES